MAIIVLASPLVSAENGGHSVTVGINHAPPYRVVGDEGVTGLYVDIFNEIAERVGWDVRYVEAPFRRILLVMEEGVVDVMLGPLKTDERERMMAFVAPVFPPERKLFFYYRDEYRINEYDDLYGKKIGVLDGASYFETFDSDEKLTKEPIARYENLMRMLELGRVDVVVAPELVGRHTVRQLDIDVSVSPYQVPGEHSYIAISRTSPVFSRQEEINQVFDEIRQDGTYDKLVMGYRDHASK
ncbi:transporter substrate-binding domain-containing protein [Marinobacter sp. ATCH36]|uniref:substrate-binding periplasmic protein n=1 Tax=Marinobacter sp. ATCH36 TaxID=2945106 RepID=UPI00201FD424|nr:transporter substrate-binding domain-containing protein [Marinobacter sp. ATCH36]MCL7942460.1 transporter substrate-binding domain-containing protein [Marinobacter sp. ATCH36]